MTNQNIPKKILYWYDNNKRALPWRKKVSKKKQDYFTLVSEFMLQQTQVKTVIPYFEKFIKEFPNLKSLAKSSDHKILKNWEGLGYYSRARNLKKTAIKLLKDYKGELPEDIETLKSLPGIGEYTSRSILAIAHNKPYIPMDGNVERILKRVFLLKTDYEICKPSLPYCFRCPLTQNCKSYKKKDFLIKSKNKFNKTKYFEANVNKYKNNYLLIKNKKFNFLKNLIIFPMIEIDENKFENSTQKKINVKMSNMDMKIIINKNIKVKKTNNSIMLNKENIKNYILPSFTKKILNSVSQ